jgi:phosphotransferase system IIB component
MEEVTSDLLSGLHVQAILGPNSPDSKQRSQRKASRTYNAPFVYSISEFAHCFTRLAIVNEDLGI